MRFRGHSPRTICATWGNRIRHVVCRSVCFAPTVGGGVLDAPCAGLLPGLGWMYPSGLTVSARVTHGAPDSRPQLHASNPAGTARAPFLRAHPRYPSTHAGRAWKPSPTVGREVPASHPRCPQPLSHGALRRDSSPFRGAEAGCCAAALSVDRRRQPLSHALWRAAAERAERMARRGRVKQVPVEKRAWRR